MGVDLGVTFYTQTMNIKRNIIFCLENRKKTGNLLLRMCLFECVLFIPVTGLNLQLDIG